MPAFSITPLTDIPPPAAESFPNFISFENQGEALGLPDADTLNFAEGLTATRGTGENSNVVTVTAEDGASGSIGAMIMIAPDDPLIEERMLFDGTPYMTEWSVNMLVPSADWEWVIDLDNNHLHIINGGVYSVTMTCFLDTANYGAEWPDGNSTYGSIVSDTSTSAQARTHTAGDLEDDRAVMRWTDQHLFTADDDSTFFLGVYAKGDVTDTPVWPGIRVVIARLGDLPE